MNFSSKKWKHLDRCFGSKLSSSAKYFCLYLLLNGGSGKFYLGDIAGILDCSVRSAGKSVNQLVKYGFLNRTLYFHDRSYYELKDFSL